MGHDHDEDGNIVFLDCEDDLSMEGGDVEQMENLNKSVEEINEVLPGTSKEGNADAQNVDAMINQLSEDKLANNPVIQRMIQKFFQDQFKNMENRGNNKESNVQIFDNTGKGNGQIPTLKSPSDTTMYAPALQKKLTPTQNVGIGMNLSFQGDQHLRFMNDQEPVFVLDGIAHQCHSHDSEVVDHVNRVVSDIVHDHDETRRVSTTVLRNLSQNLTNLQLVSNFVDAVRLEQHPQDADRDRSRRKSDYTAVDLETAQEKADRAIIEAEKFRATVEPPGNFSNKFLTQVTQDKQTEPMRILDIGSRVSDDDFFHLTCHIDPSLIHKIEKGEFVELEKLLPKDKFGKTDKGRMEWVHRDGGTFLVPAQKENKIASFRCWEQAFRAYATIYCGANPHRSKEIWQYIMVINTTAPSYTWENVYNYDITFRHLMAFNPQCSWAVTYNQMWNLSMRDPLPRNGYKGNGMYQHTSGRGYVASSI